MNRSLSFAVLLSLAACGNKDLCVARNVTCTDATLLCDPDDGVCKCGGHGGVICQDQFVCDPESNTCLSTRCAGIDCSASPGTSCDVFTAMCACGGTGGAVCSKTEVCNPASKQCQPAIDCNRVACPTNQLCDSASGNCLCAGAQCMPGQFCSPSGTTMTCISNLCNGVHCSGATTCDPADGYCKCNGDVCQSGSACECPAGPTPTDGGTCAATARTCQPGNSCLGSACDGGTTCDPVDGQCKCGGPGGPVCSAIQICSLTPALQCQGGEQCTQTDGGAKICPGGTSCDSEDGVCKCGGRGGQLCAPADGGEPAYVCVSSALEQSCKRPCDVRTPDCPMGNSCFFDSSVATPVAYCAAPTGMQTQDGPCTAATACYSGSPPVAMNCNGLAPGQTGLCEPYCDVASGMSGCLQVPFAEVCAQIGGAPDGYGFCQEQE